MLITLVLSLFLASCSPTAESNVESATQAISPPKEIPPQVTALIQAYPGIITDYRNGFVFCASGDSILFDDGKQKTFEERLNQTDIEDMFLLKYDTSIWAPAYLSDPGRMRNEALFQAIYGHNESEVRKNLVQVDWFGQKVLFTNINGAADQLRKVAQELAQYPELRQYLNSSGTFYWRNVRGSKTRMSAHSYGIAFDIGVDKSNYWLWSGAKNETDHFQYQNRFPLQIIRIFEKHGFIWGGRWYHYDTMHFEYRPEMFTFESE